MRFINEIFFIYWRLIIILTNYFIIHLFLILTIKLCFLNSLLLHSDFTIYYFQESFGIKVKYCLIMYLIGLFYSTNFN